MEPVIYMWREFIQNFTSSCYFWEPASLSEVAEVEQALGVTLPEDLRNLLQETNGAAVGMAFIVGAEYPGHESHYCSLVWSTGDMLKENLQFRAFDEDNPYIFAPLKPLLFFASLPNGDPVAFRVVDEHVINSTVIAMSHENYATRWEVAASLRDFLTWMLHEEIKV